MIKITRGDEPQDLAAARARELPRARKYFVVDQNSEGFDFTAYKIAKVNLNDVTNGKCAYCESYYDATSPADVEHFRPKGAVEGAVSRTVPGYWWLAAVWSNLLPSCVRCNREEWQSLYDSSWVKVGKGERFPLYVEANRASNENEEAMETPLLLDPSIDQPTDFLKFEIVDQVCLATCLDETEITLSGLRARASIDVYGLNRRALVKDRTRYLLRARASLRKIELAMTEMDRLRVEGNATDFPEAIIADEIGQLRLFTNGDDRFTGMLKQFINPELERMGIAP
jgi:uncharacterized protein (TIGR02646 family)